MSVLPSICLGVLDSSSDIAAAYGWKADMTADEILEKLLALNLERAAGA